MLQPATFYLGISTLALASCVTAARIDDVTPHDVVANMLVPLTPQQREATATRGGYATRVVLSRLCITDTGRWLQNTRLTVGVALKSGDNEIAKGVLHEVEVVRNSCINVRDKQIIDPFIFNNLSYEIQLSIVTLPSEQALILRTLLGRLQGSAKVSSTAAGPYSAMAAAVGSSLFDAFIRPHMDEKTLVEFVLGFQAYEVVKNADVRVWRDGTLVLLGKTRDPNASGERASQPVDVSKLRLDDSGDLVFKDGSGRLTNAPYLVMRIISGARTGTQEEANLSTHMQDAALALKDVDDATPRGIAGDHIARLAEELERNRQNFPRHVTELFGDAVITFREADEALRLAIKPDIAQQVEVKSRLTGALKRIRSFLKKYGDPGCKTACLYDTESRMVTGVSEALTTRILDIQNAAQFALSMTTTTLPEPDEKSVGMDSVNFKKWRKEANEAIESSKQVGILEYLAAPVPIDSNESTEP